jgi:hypothetical protein
MGEPRKESSRNAPDTDDHFRPPRFLTSVVEIWRSHDGLSLRQRNPTSRRSWPQEGDSTEEAASWRRELLFEFAALGTAVPHSLFAFYTCSMGEEGMTLGCSLLLSLTFYLFSKGP